MNILVTGGAGFIASHVADALIAEGHAVVVVDNLTSGRRQNVNPAAVFYPTDIRSAEIGGIMKRHAIDAVIHHAAQMDIRKSVADPCYDASVNILGSLNLLESCRQTGVKRFMFASTGGAVYGEQERFPADESHPTNPMSPYGIAKLAVEKYLWYYHRIHGLHYNALRYANVYGPRQNPEGEAGVIAIFASRMFAGEQPVINGPGTQTRDYVYVGDVVRANLAVLRHDQAGAFNVGTGVETDVNRLFHLIREYTGSKCREIHGPAKQGEQERSVLDTGKIQRVLGWRQKVSLEEGLRLTVESFRPSDPR
jgi:UDP-glucose 4-epimerase